MTASAPDGAARVRLGLRGLWLVLPIAALLAAGAGGPEPSLLVLGPLVGYALPLIIMVAFWWEDWPGTRLRPSWSGWADTALIAAGAVGLTAAGQAVAGGFDARGLFDPSPGPGHVPTFPATLPLAGAAFVVMLEIGLVGEGWPLRRLRARVAGPLAVAVSWALALVLYFALVEVVPPPGSGVAARSGPVAGADFGAAAVCVGAWQVLCCVVWRGRLTSRLSAARLPAAHALVLGGGLLTYGLLRSALDVHTVTALAGCFVAAGLAVGMLFDAPADRPLALAAITVLVTAALFFALSALAAAFTFTRAEPADWVAHATLNALAVSIILHVTVGHRRPFTRP
jgi:hypothetical protein